MKLKFGWTDSETGIPTATVDDYKKLDDLSSNSYFTISYQLIEGGVFADGYTQPSIFHKLITLRIIEDSLVLSGEHSGEYIGFLTEFTFSRESLKEMIDYIDGRDDDAAAVNDFLTWPPEEGWVMVNELKEQIFDLYYLYSFMDDDEYEDLTQEFTNNWAGEYWEWGDGQHVDVRPFVDGVREIVNGTSDLDVTVSYSYGINEWNEYV